MSAADKFMERRAALAKEMQDLATRAIDEGRDLSGEEQQTFERMNAEVDALQTRAKAILEGEERAKDLEESYRKANGEPGKSAERQAAASDFAKWARESRAGDVYDVPMESRAMAATGGVAQNGVHSQLWEYAVETSEILGYLTLMTTEDGNTIPMPKATVHADTGADVAANAAIPDSDSTLDTEDLSVTKKAYKTAVPNELLQDATFDVEGYIARNAGRSLGNTVARIAAAGATAGFTVPGVTTGAGILTNLGSQSTEGQGSDYLVDLFHSVIAPYRSSNGCAFGMSDGAAAVVRKHKTTDGAPVWQPSMVAGDPDMILGKPVFIAPEFDAFGASAKPIWFGDWKALVARIAGGLRFERSAEAGFSNDQTVFRAIVRTGAIALDPNAVKHLATPAA